MTIYELTTNEGKFYIRCRPTFEEQMAYIKDKLAKGYKLSEIMYCYGPIGVGEYGPGRSLLREQKKATKS